MKDQTNYVGEENGYTETLKLNFNLKKGKKKGLLDTKMDENNKRL